MSGDDRSAIEAAKRLAGRMGGTFVRNEPATPHAGRAGEVFLNTIEGFGASWSRDDEVWHIYTMPGIKPFCQHPGWDGIDQHLSALRFAKEAATALQSLLDENRILLENDAIKAAAIDNSLNQLGAQDEELQSLRAENERLIGVAIEALQVSANRFWEYVVSHQSKRTPDGDAKAERNKEMAEMCERSIAALKETRNG